MYLKTKVGTDLDIAAWDLRDCRDEFNFETVFNYENSMDRTAAVVINAFDVYSGFTCKVEAYNAASILTYDNSINVPNPNPGYYYPKYKVAWAPAVNTISKNVAWPVYAPMVPGTYFWKIYINDVLKVTRYAYIQSNYLPIGYTARIAATLTNNGNAPHTYYISSSFRPSGGTWDNLNYSESLPLYYTTDRPPKLVNSTLTRRDVALTTSNATRGVWHECKIAMYKDSGRTQLVESRSQSSGFYVPLVRDWVTTTL